MAAEQAQGEDAAPIALTVDAATQLCERGLRHAGYSAEEAAIIAGHLLDAELCGYPALGLARLLTIAEDPRTRAPRKPVSIVRETAVSALLDGGNYVGPYALHRAAQTAIEKARGQGIAIVGLHNSYLSGRNASYLEMIARAGLVGIHFASSGPFVVPLGGRAPVLGTNPIAFALPRKPDPVLFDMGTSAITHGEVVLAARLQQPLPDGVAIDAEGRVTRDAAAALKGGILPFAGHKGFGLSLMVQAFGVLTGAMSPHIAEQGYGFFFIAFDPGLLVPREQFERELDEFIERVRTTPRQPGVGEIRIPSERAFAERARKKRDGIAIGRTLHQKLTAL
jgi:LDH2 family malate/lactate/ureidoglycolate dehydrogenase